MRIVTRFSFFGIFLFAGLFAAAGFSGCSQEDWNWGGSGSQDKTAKPVTKAQPAPAGSKTARPEEKTAEKKPAEDAQAERVNTQIAEYSDRMKSGDQAAYESNDINGKIQRQQDPNRRNRIRKVAEDTKAPPGGETGGPEARPSALTGDTRDRPSVEKTPMEAGKDTTKPPPANAPENIELKERTADMTAAKPPQVSANADPHTVRDPDAPTKATRDETKGKPVTEPKTATGKTDEASRGADAPLSTEKEKPAQPPVLEEVKVSAPSETDAVPEKKLEAEAPRTAPNAPTAGPPTVDTFKERLQELESRIRKEPNNIEDQYRLRLMYLVGGEEDQALAPIDGTNAEMQDLVLAHLRALIAAQASTGRDPALSANQQLERVEELRSLVRSRADLMVPKVVLCTAIEGFGRYTPIEPTEFKAGQKSRVLLYIEVDNFRTEKTPSGMFRTLLSVRESLLTKSGEELWSMQDANIEDLARQQRRDFYLTIGELTIPKTLSPGEYVLKVEVEDVLAGKINSSVAKFKIVP